ncbi:TniQ family protein [Cupriavidus sp. TMH.W2]|uniref:TniQ family protein n=1 Tax=Cupriavidus sp. TMH.W2 TaxID=3434465 RepID=UPI003D77B95C
MTPRHMYPDKDPDGAILARHRTRALVRRSSSLPWGCENTPRLHGSPQPILGEAISSWIYRVGSHHRLHPRRLIRAIGYDGPSTGLDFGLDRAIVRDRLSILLQTHPAPIAALTFTTHSYLNNSHYLFLTYQFHSGRPVQRWCPACMRDGATPYFRYVWRLEFNLCCPEHQCWLRDQCTACGARQDLALSGDKGRWSLPGAVGRCIKCDGELALQSCTKLDDEDFELLRGFYEEVAKCLDAEDYVPRGSARLDTLPKLDRLILRITRRTHSSRKRIIGFKYDVIFRERWHKFSTVDVFSGK